MKAIARGSWDELKGELGDLLLQVVYYAQMGAEEGRFTFDDIARAISDKMIARHPHVFGDETRDKSAEDQTRDWERIKAAERAAVAGDTPSALDGVALALPALSRALKLQKRAARVGFDWTDTRDVLAKIAEEAGELAEARDQLTPDAVEDEMGDLLFVVTNLARHLDVDPEAALRRTNAKFERRFRAIEATLTEQAAVRTRPAWKTWTRFGPRSSNARSRHRVRIPGVGLIESARGRAPPAAPRQVRPRRPVACRWAPACPTPILSGSHHWFPDHAPAHRHVPPH